MSSNYSAGLCFNLRRRRFLRGKPVLVDGLTFGVGGAAEVIIPETLHWKPCPGTVAQCLWKHNPHYLGRMMTDTYSCHNKNIFLADGDVQTRTNKKSNTDATA
jgi:hypothetical protein